MTIIEALKISHEVRRTSKEYRFSPFIVRDGFIPIDEFLNREEYYFPPEFTIEDLMANDWEAKQDESV